VDAAGPQVTAVEEFLCGEAAQRADIVADELRRAELAPRLAGIEGDGQRLDDDGLALLAPAQGLLGDELFRADPEILLQEPLLLLGLAAHLERLAEQFDEHADLGAQDLRLDGLEHIVDRAHRVAAQHVRVVLVHRGEEDDGHVAGALARANERRRLVAVHARHQHVEQDDREVVLEKLLERILAGADGDDLADILHHPFHGVEVMLVVVDDQDARAVIRRGRRPGLRTGCGGVLRRSRAKLADGHYSPAGAAAGTAGCQLSLAAFVCDGERAIHTRSRDRSRSMSTGFAT
jgi:hypothetical protein